MNINMQIDDADCVPLFLGLGGDIDLPDGDVVLPEFKDHTPSMFTERLSTLLELECVKMENASSTRKVIYDFHCTLLGYSYIHGNYCSP